MNPKISVLLPAHLGYSSVASALEAWDRQSRRDQLELLVLIPGHLMPPAAELAAIPAGHILIDIGAADLHEGRAIGIQRASGEYVMLAEDHCLPDPEWAAFILPRVEQGWAGIGSALRPGCRSGCWPEGSFLIGYGEWMSPVQGGPVDIMCGWNGAIRMDLLRRMGAGLSGELLLGAFLVRRLKEEGHRFFLEERATMRHFDPPGFARELGLLLLVGLSFGATRCRRWPLLGRLLYPLGAPAVAWLHGKRAFTHYRRAGAAAGLRRSTLAASAVLAAVWGAGEALGALLGTARVTPYTWRTEVKPVSRQAVALSDAEERRTPPIR